MTLFLNIGFGTGTINSCFSNVSLDSLTKIIIMASSNIELNSEPLKESDEYKLLLRYILRLTESEKSQAFSLFRFFKNDRTFDRD